MPRSRVIVSWSIARYASSVVSAPTATIRLAPSSAAPARSRREPGQPADGEHE